MRSLLRMSKSLAFVGLISFISVCALIYILSHDMLQDHHKLHAHSPIITGVLQERGMSGAGTTVEGEGSSSKQNKKLVVSQHTNTYANTNTNTYTNNKNKNKNKNKCELKMEESTCGSGGTGISPLVKYWSNPTDCYTSPLRATSGRGAPLIDRR